MQRIYVSEALPGKTIELSKEQAKYLLQVHRMKTGDNVAVFDGIKNEYLATIEETSKHASLKIGEILREEQLPEYRLTLAQALPKQGKMETIIQKACELGVNSIVPYRSQFSQVKLNQQQFAKKLDRWSKIAEEACRQCRRISIPEIQQLKEFNDLFSDNSAIWLAYEGDNCLPIKSAILENNAQDIILVIGSEGGFSPEEIELARNNNAKIVSMGPRVLRTETAGLTALAIVQYAIGDLNGDKTPFIYKG